MIKAGSGTLAPGSASTYGGATLISAGVLKLVGAPNLAVAGAGTPLVWFDPSSTANMVVSGGAISQLTNLGTPGVGNAVVVGYGEPTLTVSNSAFNGLSTVHFNGAQALGGFNLSAMSGTSYTIFAVEGLSTTAGNGYLLGSNSAAQNAGLHFGYNSATDFRWGEYGDDLDVNPSTFATPPGPFTPGAGGIEVARQWTANFSTASGHALYLNGTQVGSNTNTVGLTLSPADYGIIGSGFTFSNFFTGDVGEVLIYNTSLSAAQQTAVQNYLDVKWGLATAPLVTGLLPVTTTVTVGRSRRLTSAARRRPWHRFPT